LTGAGDLTGAEVGGKDTAAAAERRIEASGWLMADPPSDSL